MTSAMEENAMMKIKQGRFDDVIKIMELTDSEIDAEIDDMVDGIFDITVGLDSFEYSVHEIPGKTAKIMDYVQYILNLEKFRTLMHKKEFKKHLDIYKEILKEERR